MIEILETERLIIREYNDSDLQEYHKLLSDKKASGLNRNITMAK